MKKLMMFLTLIVLVSTLIACKPEEEPIVEEPPKTYSKIYGYEYDPEAIDDYELVWSDEFDYEGLPDSTKWNYDVGGHGWGNNELQFYTSTQNASVSNGILTIEARKEDYPSTENKTHSWTSARMVTRNKGDFKWGRIEVSAKLPTGKGTWPAIWMLPTNWSYGDWPNSGEIDIMEHVGYDQNKIHASIHTEAYNHVKGTQKSGQKVIPTASTEFHVYSVEWFPDQMIFSIDGEPYFTFDPFRFVSEPKNRHWPFDRKFHLLLNIAIGGNWGAAQGMDPDLNYAKMEVDYVRIYQSPTIQNLKRNIPQS
ncbi:Beta-glucanase precursor [Acholeplasma oculi]|uniref:Concanavalin A-like lectin/glucanases superfamily protein n=1 Tax=Acholeplasma oculi TaxID=35623 RepID=A0A061ABS1_9MOLU|nr:glycoside hydrolase family 16 protein [Acholeplasma oculi]CDR30859.1 Concanavalin A-like lectin/glucanases superfamily protein [Acholeplasma oculi]SKC35308.1 Glycosyl hydrolases family 16 [Acholeplasma oculi]SUT89946.1 Beta-glucanase precursor [Acholeplasma oculi]